jgi:hypothetical protein
VDAAASLTDAERAGSFLLPSPADQGPKAEVWPMSHQPRFSRSTPWLRISTEANMAKMVLVGTAFSVFGTLAIFSAFAAPFGAVVPF